MDLLHFATAGSVDDGKSTLIGRLLHDTKALFDDQLEAAAVTSARRGHDGVDLALITYYDALLRDVELTIVKTAKHHDAQTLYLLQTVPGIGKILSLVLLYEIHDIARFPRVQDFASYCRLVKCAKESAGKRSGTSGSKIGNAHLKWAFSEAAVLFLRDNPAAQKLLARLEKKHSKGKALTILAHKLARAVYHMLKRQTAFDLDTFLRG
jgi:transposase